MTTRIQEPISAWATPDERHAKHVDRVDGLLHHAEELLKKNPMTAADRLQVSEKMWGAVIHTLKAIAATRGWRFHTAAAIDSMRAYLRDQSGDLRITHLFSAVEHYHVNFYEDRFPKRYLRDGITAARELNQRLWAAAASIPRDAAPPHGLVRMKNVQSATPPRPPRTRGPRIR